MKQKILKIMTVIMLIMTLTLANFLLLCVDVISYAIDATNIDMSTNHKNIEFMAYFEDEKGNKTTSLETVMNNNDLKLNLQISVKKEGYFNGAVSLETSNFIFNTDVVNADIKTISENTISLNQINAGDTKNIEVPISIIRDDKFDINLIDLESKILISGIYRDSTEKDIKINSIKELNLTLVSPYKDNMTGILEQKVITNKVLNYEGKEKRIIQMQVISGLEDNLYPIKSSLIEITTPKVSDKNPEDVIVNSMENLISTGNVITENDYNYNKDTGIININLENKIEDNKINWAKTGNDAFIVTYIFENIDEMPQLNSKISSQISLYDKNNTTINSNNSIELTNEEIDSVVTITNKQNEDNIYKGKLYAGISRDITYSTFINVNLANIADNIDIVEEQTVIEGENLLSNINTTYKTTKVNKEQMQKILGENGIITIINAENGNEIASISKDSETDENGYVNIIYSNEIKKIEVKTTKPEKFGKIEIINTKTISNIDANIVKNATNIKSTINGKYLKDNKETQLQEYVSNINLKETTTSAQLEINKDTLSAMTTNENVEIRVILQSKDESNELFKNPVIRVQLPEKFENIEITSIKLLYEDELRITSSKLVGTTIEIALEGEQTKYKEEAIEGAILIINANLTTSKKISSSTEQINLIYTNDNVNNYENGLDVGKSQKDISIISYAGIITTNKIADYGIEVINNEGNKDAKLAINDETKNIQISNEVINNVGNAVNNVNIIGTFPTKDAIENVNNIDVDINSMISINGIDPQRVKTYYSTNSKATQDLTNTDNLWTENVEDTKNVKRYLVTIDKLEPYEQVDFSYNMQIPEGLDYNKTLEEGYDVYYVNSETNVEESVDIDNVKLETGKGPVVDANLKVYVGNEEIKDVKDVKEGEILTYQIIVQNTGSEESTNISVQAKVPENTVYVEDNEVKYEMSDEESDFNPFNEYKEVKDVSFNIEKLLPGETVTKSYKVKVNADAEGKTVSNIVTINYGEVSKTSNEIVYTVKGADFELSMYAVDNSEGVLKNDYSYTYILNVTNISNVNKKHIKVNMNIPDIVELQNITYILNDECVMEEKNNYINIDELKAGEKVEIGIVIKTKSVTSSETQKGIISAHIEDGDVKYNSNSIELLVKPIKVETNISSTNSDSYVKEGDIIEYTVTMKNEGEETLNKVLVQNKISNMSTLLEVTKNGEILETEQYSEEDEVETGNSVIGISDELASGEQAEYKLKTAINKIPGNESSLEVIDSISIYSDTTEINNKEIKHILAPEQEITNNDEDNSSENNNDSNSQSNVNGNSTNNTDTTETKQLKSISGTAWIDEDEDGEKDSNEQLLNDLTVKLLNTKTNTFLKDTDGKEITVKTNQNGFYSFDSIERGEYIVIFEYDSAKYVLTSYEKDGIDSNNSSKVINKQILVNGEQRTVGATEIIKIENDNISNINIGLQKAKNFDLKLDKYISKVIIQNSKGTTTDEYKDTTFAKAEIDAKLMNSTTAVVEYTIKVTNTGDADAYVRKIADYISKDYKFSSDLNKDWYQSGNAIYNSSLSNEKIKSGESKEVKLIVTKQMTENNTGLINNTAEIVESYNDYGLKDNNDNNKASADLILSIKTGQIVTTLGLILVTIIIIGTLTYIIAKYVLRRKLI